ncbi:MAG: GGDEF domain-containing protein [Dehalococcoidia bacterium]|nr:GGDEF domain-containing protein [Dehalococcoidia bacterium]
MQATEQEAAGMQTTHAIAGRAERDGASVTDLGRYRWLTRGAVAVMAAVCAAAICVAHAALTDGEFYLTTSIVLPISLLGLFAIADRSRKTHVELERRYRARLFIRNLELQDMAMRDDLTQLFNRRYFFERLRRELDRARSLQSPLAILVLDVDRLKDVNDAYGHKAGDMVLANVAKVLVKCTRTHDIPARLGGDEFGVIMPETDKDGAFAVANRLQRALDVTPVYEQDSDSLKASVSLGVSGFPWGGDSVDEVVQWADTHVYAAKTSRKNKPDPLSSACERSRKDG